MNKSEYCRTQFYWVFARCSHRMYSYNLALLTEYKSLSVLCSQNREIAASLHSSSSRHTDSCLFGSSLRGSSCSACTEDITRLRACISCVLFHFSLFALCCTGSSANEWTVDYVMSVQEIHAECEINYAASVLPRWFLCRFFFSKSILKLINIFFYFSTIASSSISINWSISKWSRSKKVNPTIIDFRLIPFFSVLVRFFFFHFLDCWAV